MFLNSKYQGKYRMISEEILWLKKLEKYLCYTIATMKTYSNYLLNFFDWLYQVYQIVAQNILKMKQAILEVINYVRIVSKKRLSIANILSRISKTSAFNLDTRSLEKELHQMIAKGITDSSYKIVNNVNP